MAGQWKLPFAASQEKSRNFYFGSSSATPWCNDLSHRHSVKNEEKIAMHQRKTDATDRVRGAAEPRAAPARGRTRSLSLRRAGSRRAVHQCVCRVPCQVVAPIPWACHYDANMEPWSPFKDTPEIPIVRPRTAMLMMRKMLLSNPAAGLSDAAPPPKPNTSREPSTDRTQSASLPPAHVKWPWLLATLVGHGLHFVSCVRHAVSSQMLTPAAFCSVFQGKRGRQNMTLSTTRNS